MREFFHGWRRKAGFIALMLACGVFCLWMRSRVQMDFYEISVGDREHCFGSFHGYLSWRSWDSVYGRAEGWQSYPSQMIGRDDLLDLESVLLASYPQQWIIPYAWVVATMTLLSTPLILSKARKTTGTKTEAPHA